ncbi:MAG: hypothetical protein U5J83_19470 [Bryobacterales bacterium]|nr:hypothetical protein [Bryobacterales bacterium]
MTNAEIAHRSCTACLVAHIGMRLKRELKWNPQTERFENNRLETNTMLRREQRAPYGSMHVLKKAGISGSV